MAKTGTAPRLRPRSDNIRDPLYPVLYGGSRGSELLPENMASEEVPDDEDNEMEEGRRLIRPRQ